MHIIQSPNETIEEPSIAAIMQMSREYARLNNPAAAERGYRQILLREPDHLEALYRLASLLRNDRPQSALPLLDAAIAKMPDNASLHMMRAATLHALQRPLDALDACVEAIGIAPDNAGIIYDLGLTCAELCCPEQAEVYARHLLARQPDWTAAHYLLLRALTGKGADSAELDARYEFLIKTDPLNVSLRFARALLHLKMGDYGRGWDGMEWRWEIEPVKSGRLHCAQPRWAGGPLAGRRLLVLGEQGFGDIIQFARYLPLLIARGAQVTLQLDRNRAPLAPLLARIDGLRVVVGSLNLPECDLHCPLGSLPYAFGTTVDTIPTAPYLAPDAAAVERWKERLAHLPRPWVGVCWGGSPEHSHDVRRSLPLCADSDYYRERQARERRIVAAAERVARIPGLEVLHDAAMHDAVPAGYSLERLLRKTPGTLISLQVGPHASAVGELPDDLRARLFAPLAHDADFHDTAALVQTLDEVISVDTSVAHVAGALGKPCLTIKPAAPEWRWIERNGRSAWYPAMRVIDQHMIDQHAAGKTQT
jgi:hypothetical protein